MNSYLDYSGRDDRLSGGARLIPISTPKSDSYFAGVIDFVNRVDARPRG